MYVCMYIQYTYKEVGVLRMRIPPQAGKGFVGELHIRHSNLHPIPRLPARLRSTMSDALCVNLSYSSVRVVKWPYCMYEVVLHFF